MACEWGQVSQVGGDGRSIWSWRVCEDGGGGETWARDRAMQRAPFRLSVYMIKSLQSGYMQED